MFPVVQCEGAQLLHQAPVLWQVFQVRGDQRQVLQGEVLGCGAVVITRIDEYIAQHYHAKFPANTAVLKLEKILKGSRQLTKGGGDIFHLIKNSQLGEGAIFHLKNCLTLNDSGRSYS